MWVLVVMEDWLRTPWELPASCQQEIAERLEVSQPQSSDLAFMSQVVASPTAAPPKRRRDEKPGTSNLEERPDLSLPDAHHHEGGEPSESSTHGAATRFVAQRERARQSLVDSQTGLEVADTNNRTSSSRWATEQWHSISWRTVHQLRGWQSSKPSTRPWYGAVRATCCGKRNSWPPGIVENPTCFIATGWVDWGMWSA